MHVPSLSLLECCLFCDKVDFRNHIQTHWYISLPSHAAAVLRGIPYKNNSIVTLENIGVGDDALVCITNLTACCRSSDTGINRTVLGNWYFPNGTRVRSQASSRVANGTSNEQQEFYRSRGQMMVLLHRRRCGEEGIYRCEIPDAMNVIQSIYIGVYSASTGEWWM